MYSNEWEEEKTKRFIWAKWLKSHYNSYFWMKHIRSGKKVMIVVSCIMPVGNMLTNWKNIYIFDNLLSDYK